jgi:5-methylcytosine-specific restriction protein A
MSILKNLFKLYQIDEDDLSFGLAPVKEDKVVATKEPTKRYLIIPANENKFRVSDWLKVHDYIYWHQSVKYHVDDIVYMYSTAPISAIAYKFVVESINHTLEDTEEEQSYWNVEHPKADKLGYVKLRLLNRIEDFQVLNLNALLEHGMKAAPQKGIVVSDELRDFIEQAIW